MESPQIGGDVVEGKVLSAGKVPSIGGSTSGE